MGIGHGGDRAIDCGQASKFCRNEKRTFDVNVGINKSGQNEVPIGLFLWRY